MVGDDDDVVTDYLIRKMRERKKKKTNTRGENFLEKQYNPRKEAEKKLRANKIV